MRILTSALLAALVLTLPLSVIAAPGLQSTIDIKTLALNKDDLKDWPGFEIVPDRTVSDNRPDGVAVYDVTFARERSQQNLSSGPFEVRSGVARTAQNEDAVLQLEDAQVPVHRVPSFADVRRRRGARAGAAGRGGAGLPGAGGTAAARWLYRSQNAAVAPITCSNSAKSIGFTTYAFAPRS